MKTNKSWALDETAIVYQLLVFGYSNKEIIEIAAVKIDSNLLQMRTPDSVGAKCTEVRKYIVQERGGIVDNYDLSGTIERKIELASKNDMSPFVACYMPASQKRLTSGAQEQNNAPVKPQFTRPEDEQIKPPVPLGYFDKKPDINISDVMRMAKELGAVEVEYSGVKIKF